MRDPNTVRRIVAAVGASKDDRVVEIGPGTGALTELLVDLYPDLHVVEVDRRAVDALSERFADLTIHHTDVLDVEWRSLAPTDGGREYVKSKTYQTRAAARSSEKARPREPRTLPR